jgi:hypothetical protein
MLQELDACVRALGEHPNPNRDALYPWVRDVLPRAEAELRVALGPPLGEGGINGIAFRPPGKGYVVKITRSLAEVEAVRRVLAMRAGGRGLGGLVTLASCGPVPLGEARDGPEVFQTWAIVKERVVPLTRDEVAAWPKHTRFHDEERPLHALSHASHAALEWSRTPRRKDRARLYAEHLDWLARAAAQPDLAAVVASLREMAEDGTPVYDAYPGNLGRRLIGDMRIVAYDFDLAEVHAR